jgi:hypothetical protein
MGFVSLRIVFFIVWINIIRFYWDWAPIVAPEPDY